MTSTTLHPLDIAEALHNYTLTELQEHEAQGINDIQGWLESWQVAKPGRERDEMIAHWTDRLADPTNRFFNMMSEQTAEAFRLAYPTISA
jgi:hypothetical protein